MIEIRWKPAPREQLQFVAIWMPAFFLFLTAIAYWRFHSPKTAIFIGAVGLVLTVAGVAVSALRRPLYVAFMLASFPIGWVVSHLVLIIVFYLVITPIGLILRLLGRDPMERRLDPAAPTYWTAREPKSDIDSYFRQY